MEPKIFGKGRAFRGKANLKWKINPLKTRNHQNGKFPLKKEN